MHLRQTQKALELLPCHWGDLALGNACSWAQPSAQSCPGLHRAHSSPVGMVTGNHRHALVPQLGETDPLTSIHFWLLAGRATRSTMSSHK